jgi:hypothetical protein
MRSEVSPSNLLVRSKRKKFLILLARPKRFELLTPRFVVWCSIQLSYGRARKHEDYILPNANATTPK